MKNKLWQSGIDLVIAGLEVVLVTETLLLPFANGAVIWNGPLVAFTNQAVSDQDRITPNVWLTRGSSQGIYNARTEPSFQHFFSPADTAWADGTTANYASLTYTDWNTWAKITHNGPPNTAGVNAVVHLLSEDIYLDIQIISWPIGSGFSYVRSTPSAAPVPPALTGTTAAGDGTFLFTFTNTPGYNFTVLGTTNLSLPLTNWPVLGQATYDLSGPGNYLFTDPGAGTNQPQQFYQVRWP
jgi:hypothetical protein